MEKKEFYKHMLPHYQQPGQEYFITWSLIDAIPPKAFEDYTKQMSLLQAEVEFERNNKAAEAVLAKLKMELVVIRRKYLKAYDDLLHLQTKSIVDLTGTINREIVMESLHFWEGKRIENYAFCVMCNHVHWVLRLFEKDENNEPVYLQDILHSVKRFSANRINKNEGKTGALWQKESFDTTIRDERHLYNAIKYTIHNPVQAGLVINWKDWKGTYLCPEFSDWF